MTMDERSKVVRAWATDELYRWLTAPSRLHRSHKYVEDGAQLILSGRISMGTSKVIDFSTGESKDRFGGPPNLSEAALSLTATRLARSFGEDSDLYSDLETWPESVGYTVGLVVDYSALADRLLRQLVPEYVPGEVRGTSAGETSAE
jgi:hypothetical protein